MALQVKSVNLYAFENSKIHKTNKFEAVHLNPPTPIFRRGEEFVFDVQFENRPYSEQVDKLRVILNYEDEEKRLLIAKGGAWLTDQQEELDDMDLWSLRLIARDGNLIKLKMRSPIGCPIGCWKMTIKTSLKVKIVNNNYEHPETIYILFNPWHSDDAVYMPETNLLGEYILNDIGKVYTGTKGRHWLFGQFESHVLLACRKLLKSSDLSFNDKGDPVLIARMLTRVVNDANYEENGILVGNWSGDYSMGKSPSMWTGSSPILKEYLENDCPVKFGQCWVFASVICTICRAIGIPARVVTNLSSAHDTDSTLTIDHFYDENGDPVDYDCYDSVWNFHVWNDVWMARNDLPSGYGGWQAIDATPQEESEGHYQCGPASIVAIKRGEVGFNYDMPFILAEVNADCVDWKIDEEALLGFTKIKSNTTQVGLKLLTKKPFIFDPNGDRDQDNVMDQYKAPEGSREERITLLRAAMKCGDDACKYFGIDEAIEIEEVKFSLNVPEDGTIFIGKNFKLNIEMENTADSSRTIQISCSIWSIYYTGIRGKSIKKVCESIEVPPYETKQFEIEVYIDEYLEKLVEFSLLKTHVIATVEETKQIWAGEKEFQITKPALIVQTEEILEVDKPGKIIFCFTNPLSKTLTECELAYDCPGLIKHQSLPFRDILPEENVKIEVNITPKSKGKLTLITIFYSKQLHELLGSASVEVI